MRGEIIFGLSMAVFGIVIISDVLSALDSVTHILAGAGFVLAGVLFAVVPYTEFGDVYTGSVVWLITWEVVWYFGAISMFLASLFYIMSFQ
ncbi:hypothetical protein [Natronorubrum tibetense]|uniref:hypothetical protein n=1 Tax=Natronorubrum tibetense TaxID=63128 RepID=UPI001B7F8E0B|nr:hypothetical protein [Natronorubrum tibetense]